MAEPNRRTLREDDLKAGNRPNQGADPLATLTTDPFKFSAYNYPVDIETLSHALLFNINVNDRSSDIQSGGREQKAEGTYVDFQQREAPADFQSRQSKLKEGKLGLERKYTRVKRAISLYVPDTVVFDNAQRYETPSLIEKLGIVGTSAVTGGGSSPLTELKDAIRNASPAIGSPAIGFLEGLLGGLSPGAAGALSATALGNIDRSYAVTAARTFATLSGYALNPVIEVLYSQPFLRTYNFEFVFSPRSQREADMVWQIIYEFRRHSAPEFAKNVSLNLTNNPANSFGSTGELGGLILIPPSEFDITFLRKTPSGFIENTNIPRMSTCVLSQVQVDYASSGSFVTFEDGMPVQTRMALSFIELNIITREAIDKGY